RSRRIGGESGAIEADSQTYRKLPPQRLRMLPPKPGDTAKDVLKALVQLRDAANQLQEASKPVEDSARRLVASVRTATDHRAEGALRSLTGVNQLLAARKAEEAMIAEFRNAQGLELFEPMLRKMFGDDFEERGQPRLDAIRRHPEWWTGQRPAPSSGARDSRP